ncbi:unnamed protein product [Heterobilharzia americana]|nr:unnamed protein product [Heterobilharzia americana]
MHHLLLFNNKLVVSVCDLDQQISCADNLLVLYKNDRSSRSSEMLLMLYQHLLKLNLAAKERINGDFDPSTTNNKPHLFCDVCQVQLPSIEAREIHEAGKKHKKLCERQPGVRMHLNTNPASNEVPISINTTHSPENVLDNQVESPLVMDSSDNSHLVNNNKVNVTSQPTVRSFDKSDIVRLLRQVCLTQILSLMHEMTDDISPQINGESITTQSKISEHDLMEMIRSVCREELHAILRPTS